MAEADLSQVQLVTGRTAKIQRAVEMFGKEIEFVTLIVSAMVSGSRSSGVFVHRDSQLSTS